MHKQRVSPLFLAGQKVCKHWLVLMTSLAQEKPEAVMSIDNLIKAPRSLIAFQSTGSQISLRRMNQGTKGALYRE
jgi:hypothetical protein